MNRNNQFIGLHLPISDASYNAGELFALNTVQTEIVNEELEYQNHRLQKNLLQQEKYIQRYLHNENNKQIIINNEWNRYNNLFQDEHYFLLTNKIWRDGSKFFYQPDHNHEVISETNELDYQHIEKLVVQKSLE